MAPSQGALAVLEEIETEAFGDDAVAPAIGRAFDQRPQRGSVAIGLFLRKPCVIEDGGIEVAGADKGGFGLSGAVNGGGLFHDEGNPVGFLIHEDGFVGQPPVNAEGVTVVGTEDNERIVVDAAVLEKFDEPSDLIVDLGDGGEVSAEEFFVVLPVPTECRFCAVGIVDGGFVRLILVPRRPRRDLGVTVEVEVFGRRAVGTVRTPVVEQVTKRFSFNEEAVHVLQRIFGQEMRHRGVLARGDLPIVRVGLEVLLEC